MKKTSLIILLFLCPVFSVFASGGISLGATRIIFHENDPAKSVKVNNTSENVYLMRTWVSGADSKNLAEEWVVTPPIYKLSDNDALQVKISSVDQSSLPKDRESIFFLNVLTIPSTEKNKSAPTEGSSGQVNVALNTKIKLFYRPDSIKLTQSEMSEVYNKMIFRADGKQVFIENPSAYYINFNEIKINNKNFTIDKQFIAPFSTVSIPVSEKVHKVSYRIINDFGGVTATVDKLF